MCFSNAEKQWMRASVYCLVIGLFTLFTGCGDFEHLELVEPHDEGMQTDEYVGELRARLSKMCACPFDAQLFYSSQAEPDCSWACGRMTGLKSKRQDGDDEMSQSDGDWVDGLDNSPRSGVEDEDQARRRACYSVCPDWSVIGPHLCSETAACFQENDKYIDVSAGGSSTLDTRRAGEEPEDSPPQRHPSD